MAASHLPATHEPEPARARPGQAGTPVEQAATRVEQAAKRSQQTQARPEQTRARYPDETGYIERDGVRVAWERYGDGEPAILLLPTWSIIHSRFWKAQIPYLARSHRVITFDGRGNGRSDRPKRIDAYATTEFVADALAVLDATGTPAAVGVGLSMGGGWLLGLAATHPERVAGAVFVGATVGLADREADGKPEADPDGWARWPMSRWRRDWRGFAEFFFARMFSEPHSTKQIEDCVAWALETDPRTITRTEVAPYLAYEADGTALCGADAVRAMAARVRCPSLVIHGTDDRITPFESGRRLAALLDAPLVALEGAGHCPLDRDPVKVNLLIRDFVRGLGADRPPVEGAAR